jgi:ribosomal protein S18 acetylase RimI-like enzyme
MMENLIRIEKDMIPRAAAACARAFEKDPYTLYLIPDEKKRTNLRFTFEFYMRMAIYSGAEAYTTSSECESLAIWVPSEKKEPWDAFLHAGNPFLPLRCGLRYIWGDWRANHFCEKLKKKHAPKQYMYLAVLSVDPPHQSKGLGSTLVKPMLKRLDDSGLTCWVETQNTKNVKMYQHFGFELVYEGIFPGTPTPLFAMLRKAKDSERERAIA